MRTIDGCRSCRSDELELVLDLGPHRLSDFRDDDAVPSAYPLVLVLCRSCALVQLRHTAPATALYHERYSFKSGISEQIRGDLGGVVRCALDARPDAESWLDIGSNDGTLLSFVPTLVKRVGIDPLRQFAGEAWKHADSVIVGFFSAAWFGATERFDIITSVSMFYDIDDPNAFVRDVASVLADDGVWVIQQNYLPAMLSATSVDNVSHEHLTYFSLTSLITLLDRWELEVNDVSLSSINGGCFRTVISHRGARPVEPEVARRLRLESAWKLSDPETYREFAQRSHAALVELRELVERLVDAGRRVWVYGASTRGGTIWQAAGLDARHLPYVVERNPAKIDRIMSAIGARIISEEQMRRDPPDYLLVGPWWFADQFATREADFLARGGRMIIPLPRPRVIGANGRTLDMGEI